MDPDEETGTTIRFWPNTEIFETVDFDYDTLRTPLAGIKAAASALRSDDPDAGTLRLVPWSP